MSHDFVASYISAPYMRALDLWTCCADYFGLLTYSSAGFTSYSRFSYADLTSAWTDTEEGLLTLPLSS